MVRDPFFIPNPKYNHYFNETILETLSMPGKALKKLLNISDNLNPAARLACDQSLILK